MQRAANLAQLSEPFDLLVVGGGAAGLGAALDAAARGYRVALVEERDFAAGGAGSSPKLAHGGLPYSTGGGLAPVRRALREQALLARNAPHLLRDQNCLVPLYDWWEGPYYSSGLRLYEALAGRAGSTGSRVVSRAAALDIVPTLRDEGLRAAVTYGDSRFDDARLAVTLARTAGEHGAAVVNAARAVHLLHDGGRVRGAVVQDLEGGEETEVRARAVINATGMGVDAVRAMDDPTVAPAVHAWRSVNAVLPSDFLPGDTALVVQRGDARVLYAVPWEDRVLIGRAGRGGEGGAPDQASDLSGLIEAAGRYLSLEPRMDDLLSTFSTEQPRARALPEGREHAILVAKSGLVSVIGGRWTTYRHVAEEAVDRALLAADLEARPSRTEELRLHGTPAEGETPAGGPYGAYGSDARHLLALEAADPRLAAPLHPALPYRLAQVVWAVRQEMALTLEDVLSRRTRALVLGAAAALAAAPLVARLMADELGRGAAWEESQLAAFALAAGAALPQPTLSPAQA